LASLATINNARVIHFTTDCVFNGDRGNYTEQNPSDAEDMYGKSKNLGELCYPNCLTLRTSFIGHELGTSHGLIEWFMAQKESAKGYSKAIYSGVPTIELAHILDKYVIENDKLSGLYHLSALPISKLDLITLVAKEYDKKINIIADDKVIIDRSLNSDRFQQMTGYTPKSWSELVNAMFEDYQRCNYYGKYN
jgi:dTDP-4-dehydrorhamnose reductase